MSLISWQEISIRILLSAGCRPKQAVGYSEDRFVMATAQLVSVEEYLRSSFEYDAEYVEGRIVYRPLPQKSHSKMQGNLYSALRETGRSSGHKIWPELRIRTKREPARFRVPDLCVTLGEPAEEV